jgi:hypothetical protein
MAKMAGRAQLENKVMAATTIQFRLPQLQPKWKSTYMMARILMGLFHWDESLQVSTAHRLVTSLEQFRAIVQIIEENADLANQVKRIRWQHGAEEIQTITGNRDLLSKLVDQQLEVYQTRIHPHG